MSDAGGEIATGRRITTAALDDTPRLWTLPRWADTAAALRAFVRCAVPWRVVDDVLVSAPVDRAACAPAESPTLAR